MKNAEGSRLLRCASASVEHPTLRGWLALGRSTFGARSWSSTLWRTTLSTGTLKGVDGDTGELLNLLKQFDELFHVFPFL